MSNFKKLALAILAASFCASTPVIAADTTVAPAITQAKPDLGGALKDKAASAIQKGQEKVDTAAQNMQKSMGIPDKNATQPKTETLDVSQETVTVETPQGTAQETTTVITPETAPAAPAK